MKKMNWKRNGCLLAGAWMLAVGIGAAPALAATVTAGDQVIGTVRLNAEPEIRIDYNRYGDVITLTGENQKGKDVVENIRSAQGRDCEDVVEDVVEELCRSGYLGEAADGTIRQLVLKLDEDSLCPDRGFMKDLEEEALDTIRDYKISSKTLVVEIEGAASSDSSYITLDRAKELALEHLGAAEADRWDKDCELDDGVYELEFVVDGIEYEYEVDAVTGKILKAESDDDDNWRTGRDWRSERQYGHHAERHHR